MTYAIRPFTQPASGSIAVPGSKSVANRMLICAALADGTSHLSGLPDGDDTRVLLDALAELGAMIETSGTGSIAITGIDRPLRANVWAGLAGTSSRFLVALAALGGEPITVDGAESLRRRPIAPLISALRTLGARIDDTDGGLPMTIIGPSQGGDITVRGDTSSQFISALMMIGPRLPGGLRVHIDGELVSRPYVEMTASVMRMFGATVATPKADLIEVTAGGYRCANRVVEADASSASYPFAIAALTGGSVTVRDLQPESLQGDIQILEFLENLGCTVVADSTGTTVVGPADGVLRPFDLDMSDVSDLVPTMTVLATRATGQCTIRGVGFIRAKESNRLGVLASSLALLGADIVETGDGLRMNPSSLHGADLRVHEDHRMAMAFAVLGSVVDGITVDEPAVVSKSWPQFWSAVDSLRQ